MVADEGAAVVGLALDLILLRDWIDGVFTRTMLHTCCPELRFKLLQLCSLEQSKCSVSLRAPFAQSLVSSDTTTHSTDEVSMWHTRKLTMAKAISARALTTLCLVQYLE